MSDPATYMMRAIQNRIDSNVITSISSTGSSSVAACELTDDGRPSVTYQGLIFFAVHGCRPRSVRTDPAFYGTDLYYDFKVTISIKTAHIARYRIGDKAIHDKSIGLTRISDLVIVSLNGYLSLTEEANTLLLADYPSDQTFVFGERPVFLNADWPQPRMSTWFGAAGPDTSDKPMGFSQELRFQGLRHIRPIGQS